MDDETRVAKLARRIDDIGAAADGVLAGRGEGLSESGWNARCEALAAALERARIDADEEGWPRLAGAGPVDLDDLAKAIAMSRGGVDVAVELLSSILEELRGSRAYIEAKTAAESGALVREDLAMQLVGQGVLRSYLVDSGGRRYAVAEVASGGDSTMARVLVGVATPDVEKAARALAEAEAAARFTTPRHDDPSGEDVMLGDVALFAGRGKG